MTGQALLLTCSMRAEVCLVSPDSSTGVHSIDLSMCTQLDCMYLLTAGPDNLELTNPVGEQISEIYCPGLANVGSREAISLKDIDYRPQGSCVVNTGPLFDVTQWPRILDWPER